MDDETQKCEACGNNPCTCTPAEATEATAESTEATTEATEESTEAAA